MLKPVPSLIQQRGLNQEVKENKDSMILFFYVPNRLIEFQRVLL